MSPLGKALLGLHAWGGLIFSWLLVPVFITGSIAVFAPETSHWMQPEVHAPAVSSTAAVRLAEARLNVVGKTATLWQIHLPSAREPSIRIAWGNNPRSLKQEILDSTRGLPLAVRATRGGDFFTEFHSELMLGAPGKWIVGAAGIFMLAALVSGVLVHHRILRDFFTFRPQANRRRAWLDAHNLAGVAILPFLLLISYTGVVIEAETFLPAASRALYDGNPRGSRSEAVQAFERKPLGEPGKSRSLTAHLAMAEQHLGTGKVSLLLVRHPRDRNSLVQAYRHVDDRLAAVADHVTFDAGSGAVFGKQTEWNPMVYSYRTQVGLHLAHFGDATIRWIYFLSGLLGAVMMAVGMVVFLRKRWQRHGSQGIQRGMEALSVSASTGCILACIGYLWGNRLIPATLANREHTEILLFFVCWALATGHAFWRRHAAWREQFMLASGLCLGLPLIDALTGGRLDPIHVYVDFTSALIGGALFATGRRFFLAGGRL